jgi:phosphoinositide-3-kinase regulatory subunit 4
VVVAPDHAFFVTSSDDGTVRIWDTSRLERNLAHKSRHVYRHSVDVKITSLCFVENSHCFVSTGSDGSVHVVRVDASETPQGVIRYGKLRSLRIWQLPVAHAHVVWCEHYKTEDQSTLILLTSTSQIYALDLRTMEILYVLENPAQHGMPTCFCLDSQKHSLLLGTTHGILDFWDLRFHILLRSWVFRGASPIHRILLHPSSQAKHPDRTDKDQEQAQTLVCIAGGSNTSDITIWNLNKATCELAFHSTPIETTSSSASETADTKAQLNQTFTLDALSTLAPAARSARLSTLASTSPSLETTTCHDVHALTLGLAIPLSDPSNPARSTKKSEPFLVSAGPDQRIRYWNLARPQESSVVSGLAKGELLPEFVLHEPTTMGGVKVWKECKQFATTAEEKEKESIGGPMRATSSLIRSNVDTTDGDGRRKANVGARRSGESASTTLGDTARGTTGSKPTKKEKLPSMREQQEQLLKSHLDKVLDVAVLEWPTRMVVSVDRMGMIYVFQ